MHDERTDVVGPNVPAPLAAGGNSPVLDDLDAFCAAPPPGAWPPGWAVHYQPVADSTQDLARAAAEAGAPHGNVYLADWQSAGRGRRGRAWLAPPGLASCSASSRVMCDSRRSLRPPPAPRALPRTSS